MKAIYLRPTAKHFVYAIDCTAEEAAQIKAIKGVHYREGEPNTPEAGKPLWFSFDYFGEECIAKISKNNKIYADNTEMRKQASLVKQFGGDLGKSLADLAAAQLLGAKAPTQQAPISEPSSSAADIEGL
jgi:hypothetical protein